MFIRSTVCPRRQSTVTGLGTTVLVQLRWLMKAVMPVVLKLSLNLVSVKLYRFRARIHCYYFLCIIFSANPVRRSEGLRGDRARPVITWTINWMMCMPLSKCYQHERKRTFQNNNNWAQEYYVQITDVTIPFFFHILHSAIFPDMSFVSAE